MAALLRQVLEAQGYRELRWLGSGELAGLYRFNFTWGLVVGLDPIGYRLRYCFEHLADARAALRTWNGLGHPTGPWIKCKGAGVDLLNPALR